MPFALIVRLKEVKAYDGSIMAVAGTWAVVENEIDGWVEGTAHFNRNATTPEAVSVSRAKPFKTIENAMAFAQVWTGHPWYVQPDGEYRIIRIRPKYTKKFAGFARMGELVALEKDLEKGIGNADRTGT